MREFRQALRCGSQLASSGAHVFISRAAEQIGRLGGEQPFPESSLFTCSFLGKVEAGTYAEVSVA